MPSAPLRPLAAAAVFAVAGCSLTAPGDVSTDAPSLPLLIATDLSADRAPAVGDTATLAASFRFVTPDDSVYSQFNESFLRRLDSLFVANETLLVEGEVRVYPPGRSDAASDVLRVVGRAMVSQRVRRDDPVRFSVPFRAVRAGRAVVQARVRVIADEGTPLEAELGGGADYECFEVGEGASASVGNCVSSASPRAPVW